MSAVNTERVSCPVERCIVGSPRRWRHRRRERLRLRCSWWPLTPCFMDPTGMADVPRGDSTKLMKIHQGTRARGVTATFALALQAKSIEDLRYVAQRFLDLDVEEARSLDRQDLVSALSEAARREPDLARELQRTDIARRQPPRSSGISRCTSSMNQPP